MAHFEYVFPAIRGIQAGREYYVSMCLLRLIPRIFLFDEDELRPELRAQRSLNKTRIPEIARYILRHSRTYTFSALTASIDGEVRFEALGDQDAERSIGHLHIPMKARFVINDGQHRRAAIEAALRENPDLGDETIAVVYFMDVGLKRCQQMFADLNRYAIRPTTSLSILYDSRDADAQIAKDLLHKVAVFTDLIETERSTISNRSIKLFTLSGIDMSKHESRRVRERLTPNASLPNSLVYTPIEDWNNDDVWLFLMQIKNPWGHDNKSLLGMYQGATEGGECPLVVDTSTPSCGTSRFGCWVCTVVEKDRSMEAMIKNDEEKVWMTPLLELRNELDNPDDRSLRDFRRMNGHVQLFHDRTIPGPYTKASREHWLRRVLEAQEQARGEGPPEFRNLKLITEHSPSPCTTARGALCPKSGFRRERSRFSPSRCSGALHEPPTARCPRSSTPRWPGSTPRIAATWSNSISPTRATRWSSSRRTPRSTAITTRPCSPTSPGPTTSATTRASA
jgi:DGQHR domain-containing protein